MTTPPRLLGLIEDHNGGLLLSLSLLSCLVFFPVALRGGWTLVPPPPRAHARSSPGAAIFVLSFVSIEWLWGGRDGGGV